MTNRVTKKVRDVMKTSFQIIDGMTTVDKALQIMKNLSAKCLIIDKRDEHDEYGLILISDIARKVLAQDRAPERINVYEIMAKPVITIDPDMNVRYCARLFDRFELSRAPVVDHGKVIGIVSFTDMVLGGLCELT